MGFGLVVVEIEEVEVRGGGMSILGAGHRVMYMLADTGLELESLGREPGRYHGRVPSHAAGVGSGAGGVSSHRHRHRHRHGIAVDIGLLLGHDIDFEGREVVRLVVAVVDLGVNIILVVDVDIVLIERVARLDRQRSSSGQGV